MEKLELVEVDGSLAVIFPVAWLAQWQLGVGDTVYLTDALDGFHLSPVELCQQQD
jgi:hypothetical protein